MLLESGWSRTFRTTPEKTKSPESDERFPGLLTAEPGARGIG
jgi:hypothetical protein